ncbi:hypothetical protein [Lacticaseibacillus mingshuiensis]|uniref:Uncharacterized protein n=1 Tax=Lacticaseibacillus mingshuiensis TaxID=2799574 RepID=A0ABW4CI82_9LACO|nr:hypothetical protein [Lacticaseibacillus mingshuiensis]
MGKFIYIERHDLLLIIVPGFISCEQADRAEEELTGKTGIKTVILSGEDFTFVPEGKE